MSSPPSDDRELTLLGPSGRTFSFMLKEQFDGKFIRQK